jgi:chemotaxis protein CheZ
MDMQAKLGRTLLKTMVELRETKGAISLQDVGGIFISMASSLNPDSSNIDEFVHTEIGMLAKYIADAKGEIFAIQTNDKSEAVIMDASAHLDEVIKHTEEATTKIMDSADKIMAAVGGVGGDKEKNIMAATNDIFDACTFQDITGQRIRKVIKLLENIEERINKLNDLFGHVPAFAENEKGTMASAVVPKNDKDLLNGPQLKGQGSSQDDIDALFASLTPKA